MTIDGVPGRSLERMLAQERAQERAGVRLAEAHDRQLTQLAADHSLPEPLRKHGGEVFADLKSRPQGTRSP